MPNQPVNLIFGQHQLAGHEKLRKRDGLIEMAWRNSAPRNGVLMTTIQACILGKEGFKEEGLRGARH